QRRLRDLELGERILVALGAALNERIVGDRERQARDHDAAQEIAGEVDTLPERLRAQEHGTPRGEAPEERAPRAVHARREHGDTGLLERTEAGGGVAARTRRGEGGRRRAGGE